MSNVRVKLLTIAAGPEFSGQPGEIISVSQLNANNLINGGYAVAVDVPKREVIKETVKEEIIETASIAPAEEKAVKPKAKPKAKAKK